MGAPKGSIPWNAGNTKERFESKFRITPGCWIWTASTNKDGYGHLRVNGPMTRASRYSYSLYVGPIPEGMVVCHRCDNPACVNPDHLFVGTMLDNMQDMVRKGRGKQPDSKGERHGSSKLMSEQVIAIRSDARSLNEIATEYQISIAQVSRIRNRQLWRHLP